MSWKERLLSHCRENQDFNVLRHRIQRNGAYESESRAVKESHVLDEALGRVRPVSY